MTYQKRTETWAWVLGIIAAIIVVGFIGSVWQDNRVIEQAVTTNDVQTSPFASAPIATDPAPTETGIIPTENESEMGTVAVVPETAPGSVETSTDTPVNSDTTAEMGTVPTEQAIDFEISEGTNLATNPDQYLNATVAVEGVLNEAVSDGVFTVTGGGEEMLIISKTQQLGKIEKGANVRIVGTAKRMTTTELAVLESEVGYDLQDDLAKKFENQMVVVAETVQAQAH